MVLHLLKEVMIEFLTPLATSFLFHWPMQGPQALANTEPPAFSSTACMGLESHETLYSKRHVSQLRSRVTATVTCHTPECRPSRSSPAPAPTLE